MVKYDSPPIAGGKRQFWAKFTHRWVRSLFVKGNFAAGMASAATKMEVTTRLQPSYTRRWNPTPSRCPLAGETDALNILRTFVMGCA